MRVSTTDIVLAAALVVSNHRLDGMSVNTVGVGTFVFDGVDERTILSYESGGMIVEPKAYDAAKVKLARMCRDRSRK